MSLASVTAKIVGAVLHLARADTGAYYCSTRVTDKTFHTWRPEEVTCKKCLTRYQEAKRLEQRCQ